VKFPSQIIQFDGTKISGDASYVESSECRGTPSYKSNEIDERKNGQTRYTNGTAIKQIKFPLFYLTERIIRRGRPEQRIGGSRKKTRQRNPRCPENIPGARLSARADLPLASAGRGRMFCERYLCSFAGAAPSSAAEEGVIEEEPPAHPSLRDNRRLVWLRAGCIRGTRRPVDPPPARSRR